MTKKLQTKKLQLGLPYFGGKQNQAKFMEQLFPASFNRYIEPFGGTMKNFLNSDINCDAVYNDISYYQANMMRAFKQPRKFLREFRKQLKPNGYLHHPGLVDIRKNKDVLKAHYKSVFHTFSKHFAYSKPNPLGELKHVSWVDAVMYAFCLSHSVIGIPLKSFNYAHPTYSTLKFLIVMKHLQEHIKQQKFKSVNYFTGDAMQLIKEQDSEKSFFVVDPGYVGMEHYYSNRGKKGRKNNKSENGDKAAVSFTDLKMHVALAKTLKNIEGKFMLCYYYHPILEKLYPPKKYTWVIKDWRRPSANTAKTTEKKYELGMELLILNYGNELETQKVNKQHLMDSAKALLPKVTGRRNRSSYSLEFKHKVILMLESKLFKKKEILDGLGIKSYNSLSKWLLDKPQIERTLVRLKEAKDYLLELKQPLCEKIKSTVGCTLLPEKARNLIADLRHQSILSNKAIRDLFGISKESVESCYSEWQSQKVAVPFKTKLARALTYWHTMAA
jgi:site-specific DNA-adenine methylase